MELTVATDGRTIPPSELVSLTGSAFIRKGEGSESSFNSWDLAYYLISDVDRTRFALELHNYGDPDSYDPEEAEDPESSVTVVALMSDPLINNDHWIAWCLIKAYEEQGGLFMDVVHHEGEFDLERGEQLERRRIAAGGKASDIMAHTTAIDFHPAYFEVRFRTDVPVAHWPERFAIITAYATTGQTWSDERNVEADALLYAELLQRNCNPIRIVGFDPETGHSEPGWAVDLPPDEAQAIGLQFLQDAIFLVEGDVLLVARCVVGSPWVTVGAFRERLSVSRTPHGTPATPKVS